MCCTGKGTPVSGPVVTRGVCGGRGSVQETVIRSHVLARLHPWAVHCTSASGFPIVGGTGWPRALKVGVSLPQVSKCVDAAFSPPG